MKTLIITHKGDIDGLSPVVFLNLIRDNVVTNLLNANEINPRIQELIKTKEYQKYDEIYVTDLTLDQNSCDLIMSTKEDKKFHTFDHHSANLISNKYPFGTAISQNDEGVNECATSLFYKYLCLEYPEIFKTQALEYYTELVRLNDTWDWAKTNNLEANKLSDLLSILGRENYIKYYTKFLKDNKEFYFTKEHEYLLEVENDRIKRYMEDAEKTMFHATLGGKRCGIVFAEQHRSLLGNYLAQKYSYLIDYVVLINMQQGISFRSCKDTFDLNDIARVYGGGGHKKAAGAPMDNSLKREVLKLILNDNNLFNNN